MVRCDDGCCGVDGATEELGMRPLIPVLYLDEASMSPSRMSPSRENSILDEKVCSIKQAQSELVTISIF